jgi:hypothetical protein
MVEVHYTAAPAVLLDQPNGWLIWCSGILHGPSETELFVEAMWRGDTPAVKGSFISAWSGAITVWLVTEDGQKVEGRQSGGNGTDRTWRTSFVLPHLTSSPDRLEVSIAGPVERDFAHDYA